LKTYNVLLNPNAVDELRKLPQETARRVKEGLKRLRENPAKARSGVYVKHITGTLNPKLYRLRVGGYRAIFWVDEEKGEVLVEKIAPRRMAYIGI
jgi:mRNA-degrading endonuclease RelE of RelBE toxin-antitoxin system